MTGKADKAIAVPKNDRFTPEEVTDMQRRAFKLLVDRAIELWREDSRGRRAASLGEGVSHDSA